MPIILPKKPKSAFSNKTETTPKTPVPKTHPLPFIDRITITAKVPDNIPGYGPVGKKIYNSVITHLNDKELFGEDVKKFGNFKIGKRMELPSLQKPKYRPTFHMAYDKSFGASTLRFDFVPVDLGPQGISELKSALTFLPDGWDFLLQFGRIGRLDVTVDLPHMAMDEFWFLPPLSTGTVQYRVKGALQSIYFGSAKGNETCVYDRQAKRLKQLDDWQGPPTVRIERRLRNVNRSLAQLGSLPNPFSGMSLIPHIAAPPSTLPEGKLYLWTMFRDCVRVRGVADALALLPEDQRVRFRKHLKSQASPIWDTHQIWQQWQLVLDELVLAKS